jgi:hypothetical protein
MREIQPGDVVTRPQSQTRYIVLAVFRRAVDDVLVARIHMRSDMSVGMTVPVTELAKVENDPPP